MKQEWKQLYGPTPEHFRQHVRETVGKVLAPREIRLPRLAAVLAVAMVLLCSTAYAMASHLGLLDAMAGMKHLHLRNGADTMLVSGVSYTTQGENPYVEFSILEALSDGYKTWVQIKATPRNGVVLMTAEAKPWYNAAFDSQILPPDTSSPTFAEIARERGAELVMVNHTSMMTPNQYLEDGSIVITEDVDSAEVTEITIKTCLVPPDAYERDQFRHPRREFGDEVKLVFTVPVTNEQTVYAADMNLHIDPLQITMRRVSFIQTPIACYLRLEYTPGKAVLEHAVSCTYRRQYQQMLEDLEPTLTVQGVKNEYTHVLRRGNHLYELINAYPAMKEVPLDFDISLGRKLYTTKPDGSVELAEDITYASFPVHLELVE